VPLLPEPEPPARDSASRYRDPEWESPPWGEIPKIAAVDLLEASSRTAAVRVTAVRVNSSGCQFDVRALAKDNAWRLRDEAPRFGIVWPDATVVLPDAGLPAATDQPDGPCLVDRGDSYWLWPLPPPGKLTLLLDWPAMGIQETTTEIDTRILSEARAEVVHLWDDDSSPASS